MTVNTGSALRQRLVTHPVFGEGEVLGTRWSGTELLVRFQSGLQLWLPARRVKLLFSGEASEVPLPSAEADSVGHVQACRMVEAFRLGIVPRQDVEAFTFGRSKAVEEVAAAISALVEGRGGAYMIEGEYGTGKTHLLEYALHLSLRRGVAVSLVQFDPQEVTPHRPKRVYREIVHNLRYLQEGSERSFRDLLLQAAGRRDVSKQEQSGSSGAPRVSMADHIFFGPVLRKLARTDIADARGEVLWQWIEGESTKEYAVDPAAPHRVKGGQRIPALYDFSTAADFYCYVLSGLSWMCRQLGLGGLVLLIDEAETVVRLWDIIYLAKSVNFMDGLVRTAQGDAALKRVNHQMIHNRVRPVPYIYRQPYLLLLYATTPAPHDYGYIRLAGRTERRIALEPLSEQALVDAFVTMVAVYQRAYPGFSISATEQKVILRDALRQNAQGIRMFIKFCVEALDIARLRQQGALKSLQTRH